LPSQRSTSSPPVLQGLLAFWDIDNCLYSLGFLSEEVEITLTRWKLGRDSEGGGGSGSVVESDCVDQEVNAVIIVDEAGDGLKGDGVIVDGDGDTLRGITVDIEDVLTPMMEWKRGRWKRRCYVVSIMWLAVSPKCDVGLGLTTWTLKLETREKE
jgi:hypothetical protein